MAPMWRLGPVRQVSRDLGPGLFGAHHNTKVCGSRLRYHDCFPERKSAWISTDTTHALDMTEPNSSANMTANLRVANAVKCKLFLFSIVWSASGVTFYIYRFPNCGETILTPDPWKANTSCDNRSR